MEQNTYQHIKFPMRRNLFRLIVLLLILAISQSCVINKKYQYLQNDDVNVKAHTLVKDSVLRTYELTDFDYKLQPGDILSVRFYSLTPEEYDFFSIKTNGANANSQTQFGAGSLISGYLIDEDGAIEFPVVGKVYVSGLSIFEAQNNILTSTQQYLKKPVVEVRLLNFRFTLLGEVNSEGIYSSSNSRITLLEAIGLAGGFTDLSDKYNVKIIRQSKGKAEVYYLNLLDEKIINSPFYYMNQNDVIIVPPLRQRPYQTYFRDNLSTVITSLTLLLITLNFFK